MNIFFTADTHFFHKNIIKYCNRPFKDVEEMNEILIQNWNSKVQPNDLIFHLGDFGFGKNLEQILRRLNGEKILIRGSHDKDTIKCKKYFKFITSLYEFKRNNISITLCHFSMRTWNKSHYNTWHLYGHSHGTLEGRGKSFDIGVDCWNFFPLSLEEVIQEMDKRPDNPNLIRK